MNRSPVLATASMLTALCWLFLALAGFLPTGRLFVMTLASLVLVVACLELGIGTAFYVYLGASLLALLWPGPAIAALFTFCFGILPLITYFFHGKMKPITARLLRHGIMSLLLLLIINFVGIKELTLRDYDRSASILSGLTLLAFQFFLFLYDYALRSFEQFYLDRIGPWIHRRR